MIIVSSPTEQMTALTDLALFVLTVALALGVSRWRGAGARDKAAIWMWVAGLLALASLLGAIAHGLEMSDRARALVWQPLNLCLGLGLGLFMAGAILDLAGRAAARKAIPPLLGVGILFYLVTRLIPGTFMTFIAYEAVALLFSLGAYGWLAANRALPGAGWMVAGVLVTIVAAVVQATGTAGTAIVSSFDNNGVFHLIQMVGIVLIALGLRLGLLAVGH